jgi:hypothetical protein
MLFLSIFTQFIRDIFSAFESFNFNNFENLQIHLQLNTKECIIYTVNPSLASKLMQLVKYGSFG